VLHLYRFFWSARPFLGWLSGLAQILYLAHVVSSALACQSSEAAISKLTLLGPGYGVYPLFKCLWPQLESLSQPAFVSWLLQTASRMGFTRSQVHCRAQRAVSLSTSSCTTCGSWTIGSSIKSRLLSHAPVVSTTATRWVMRGDYGLQLLRYRAPSWQQNLRRSWYRDSEHF